MRSIPLPARSCAEDVERPSWPRLDPDREVIILPTPWSGRRREAIALLYDEPRDLLARISRRVTAVLTGGAAKRLALSRRLERVAGIEPARSAWEAGWFYEISEI